MADVIAIIRDIVIIVWGVLGILVFLAIILVALSIFRALKPILENVRGTTGEVRTATRLVTDAIIRPAVPVISFYTGIRQGFRVLRRFGRRGQG